MRVHGDPRRPIPGSAFQERQRAADRVQRQGLAIQHGLDRGGGEGAETLARAQAKANHAVATNSTSYCAKKMSRCRVGSNTSAIADTTKLVADIPTNTNPPANAPLGRRSRFQARTVRNSAERKTKLRKSRSPWWKNTLCLASLIATNERVSASAGCPELTSKFPIGIRIRPASSSVRRKEPHPAAGCRRWKKASLR